MTKGMMKALTSKARPAPPESGCSDLLLRFFESQFFSAWIAIQYLYTSTQPGVHDYLCNKLYELSESSLDSYLLQLVYLAVSRPGATLERTLVELASRSFRLALKLYWLLLALVQDTPPSERLRLRQLEAFKEQVERAALDGNYDVPFRNITLDPLSPLMSCANSGVLSPTLVAHTDPATASSGAGDAAHSAAPNLLALPAASGAQGTGVGADGHGSSGQLQRQPSGVRGAGLQIDLNCLHPPEARGLSLEVVSPQPGASSGHLSAGASSQEAGRGARDRTIGRHSSGATSTTSPFMQRSLQHLQQPGSGRNSLEQGQRTPQSASQQHYSRIRQQLGSGEGVTGLLERSKLAGPGGMLVATEDDGPGAGGCFSDDEGQLSGGVLSPTARLRRDTFGATLDFIEALCDASSSLTSISQEERQRALRNGLECINYEIEAAARKNVAIWFPMGTQNERVLRVTAKEAVLLNSRDKAPFMLFVEVLRCPDDKSVANATATVSGGIGNNTNSYVSDSGMPAAAATAGGMHAGEASSAMEAAAVTAAGAGGTRDGAAFTIAADARASAGSEPVSAVSPADGNVSLSSISHSVPVPTDGAAVATGHGASGMGHEDQVQEQPGQAPASASGSGSGLALGLGLGSSGGIVEAAAAALGHLASGVLQVAGGSNAGSNTGSAEASASLAMSASFSQLPSGATQAGNSTLSLPTPALAPIRATATSDTLVSTPDAASSAHSCSSMVPPTAGSPAAPSAREGGAGAGPAGGVSASPFPAGPMIIPHRRQSHVDLAALGKERGSPAAAGRLGSFVMAGTSSSYSSSSVAPAGAGGVAGASGGGGAVVSAYGPASPPTSSASTVADGRVGSSSSGSSPVQGQAGFSFPPTAAVGMGGSPGGFAVGGATHIPPPPPSPPALPPHSVWPLSHRVASGGHSAASTASHALPPRHSASNSNPVPPGAHRWGSHAPHTATSTLPGASATSGTMQASSGAAGARAAGSGQGPAGMPSAEAALLDELVGSGCLSPPRSDMPRSELQQRMAHALASLRGDAPIVRLHLTVMPGADDACIRAAGGQGGGAEAAGTAGRHHHSHHSHGASRSHHAPPQSHHHHQSASHQYQPSQQQPSVHHQSGSSREGSGHSSHTQSHPHHHHQQPDHSSRDGTHHNSSLAGGAIGSAAPQDSAGPPTALKAMLSRLGLCARPPDVSGDDPASTGVAGAHAFASNSSAAARGRLVSVRLEVAGGVDLRIVSPHRSHKRTPSVEALSKIASKYKVKSIPPAVDSGPPIMLTTPWLYDIDAEGEEDEGVLSRGSQAVSGGGAGGRSLHVSQRGSSTELAAAATGHVPALGQGQGMGAADSSRPSGSEADPGGVSAQLQHLRQHQQHQQHLLPQWNTPSTASAAAGSLSQPPSLFAASSSSLDMGPVSGMQAAPGLASGPGAGIGGAAGAMLPRRRMPPGLGSSGGLPELQAAQSYFDLGPAGLPGAPGPQLTLDPATERKRREAMAVYGERWVQRVKRVQRESPQGRRPGWALRCVIVKNGDDCRQEHLALQLVRTFKDIFAECGLPLWVRHYDVLVTSNRTALIEMIPDSLSIHTVKHRSPPGSTFSDHFFAKFVRGSPECVAAQRKLTESLAAYSLITYLLQIKDRHNGNVLVDDEGHLIHIDFGFMLSNSPGGVNFESAPFKLTRELLEVMDSNSDGKPSELFDYYKVLLIQGFLACRKHSERIVLMVKMMSKSGLPCFKSGAERTVRALEKRLALNLTEVQVVQMVLSLISDSLDAWRTRQYDYYQRVMNGIL